MRTTHERSVRRGQAITIPETLGRRGTVTRGGIKGRPVVATGRKRIWVAGVGLEGEIEGGWRWATHGGRLGLLVGHLLDVFGGRGGDVVETRGGFAQLSLAGRLWQGGRLGGRHEESGGSIRVRFRVFRAGGKSDGRPRSTIGTCHEARTGRGQRGEIIRGRLARNVLGHCGETKGIVRLWAMPGHLGGGGRRRRPRRGRVREIKRLGRADKQNNILIFAQWLGGGG